MFSHEQQKAHRLQLADHLEQNVADEQYYQSWYWHNNMGCALGHAALVGIGGMSIRDGKPFLSAYMSPLDVADEVFGTEAYRFIFSVRHASDRRRVIEKLREFT